ncbi:glycoside hydrolase superfamily [Paraphoma chrysanthemicola]|uniref:Glycoside hydrolase superfamily n=1 Tax=Paraphoma chrysanthemicola TaxID=798071 RepID=A0A8K0R0V0_9PLEO|nr:glycoside hydrolase superfamily [Paraphoma chrysanthemicola]
MGRYANAVVLAGALLRGVLAQGNGTAVKCPSTSKFTPISAGKFYDALNPGWNLGNTLDAIETEGSWNNPPVVAATFDDVKKAGYKSVRLPVTWTYHFTSQSPEWQVDAKWLQRVEDVVDMILQRGFYAIVNVHHDSWTWADLTKSDTNVTLVEEKLYKLWYQIGTKLACKGSQLAFETVNEIPGTTAEHGAVINRLNTILLQAINDAGGFNPQRVVTLVGAGEDGLKTTQWFKRPDAKFKNPWGIQYHYYSPYDFVFAAWGKTTWGSDADKAALDADIALVRNTFTDVPLVIGEWAVSPVATETSARWRYFDYFLRTAAKYNTSTVLWDNGADFLNRATHEWRDPVSQDIYRNAVKGIPNALPESTTDGATTQQSSAYVYHKKGTNVTDVTLPFKFNGNKLSKNIALGTKPLNQGKDYTVAGESITFKASFLSTVFTPSSPTGSLQNLTLTFNRGAALTVNLLQYAVPVLGSTGTKLPATSADVVVPLTWAGQNRPAAIKAVKADGTYLVDDWTQYLPPLQQGRTTYNNHWEWTAEGVIIRAAVFDAVRAAGQTTTLTIEFYPREPGNSANYTITV